MMSRDYASLATIPDTIGLLYPDTYLWLATDDSILTSEPCKGIVLLTSIASLFILRQ